MKNTFILFSIIATAVGFSSCGPVTDPGTCDTTGDFSNANVSNGYIVQICEDWVNLFLTNCIQVNNWALAINPSAADVAAFCQQEVDNSTGGTGFDIAHSCNFIDNPAFSQCAQYSAAKPVLSSDHSALKSGIANSSRLNETKENVTLSLEGTKIKASEL
jgi:hypothetical protein